MGIFPACARGGGAALPPFSTAHNFMVAPPTHAYVDSHLSPLVMSVDINQRHHSTARAKLHLLRLPSGAQIRTCKMTLDLNQAEANEEDDRALLRKREQGPNGVTGSALALPSSLLRLEWP